MVLAIEREVSFMLAFLVMNTVLNSVIYGLVIMVSWEKLGKVVDTYTTFELFLPFILCSTVSAVAVFAIYIIEGDW